MKKIYSYCFALSLLLLTSSAVFGQQTDYYVANNYASDGSPGNGTNWQHPLTTVEKALEKIGFDTNDGRTYRIFIAEGNYPFTMKQAFKGDKRIEFHGGYPTPKKGVETDQNCKPDPWKHRTYFYYDIEPDADAAGLFRISTATKTNEGNSTDLLFSGIRYSQTVKKDDGKTFKQKIDEKYYDKFGVFLTLEGDANQADVEFKDFVVDDYETCRAGFISVKSGTQRCSISLNRVSVLTGKGNAGVANSNYGGAFVRIYEGNYFTTLTITNSLFRNINADGQAEGGVIRMMPGSGTGCSFIAKGNYFCKNQNQANAVAVAGNHYNGGCIWLKDVANVTIRENTFSNNKSSAGSAINLTNCHLTEELYGNNFENNNGTYFGGAIYSQNTELIINNCNFKKNQGGSGGVQADRSGGAISFDGGESITITNSTFCENIAQANAGAVCVEKANKPLISTGNLYKSNTAHRNGGAIYSDAGIESNKDQFISNTAADQGGAIYSSVNPSKTYSFEACQFKMNTATKLDGGAMKLKVDKVTTKGNLFQENSAATNGGAIYIEGVIESKSDKFQGNLATSGKGGAVYIKSPVPASTSTSSFLKEDLKPFFFGNHSTDGDGGAICLDGGKLEVKNAVFKGNYITDDKAHSGGAIYLYAGEFTSSNTNYEGNHAGWGGGAIYNHSATKETHTDDIFVGNYSPTSASWGGGVIYMAAANASLTTTGCKFYNNHTHGHGGAIAVSGNDSKIEGHNDLFVENKIDDNKDKYGGAIYFTDNTNGTSYNGTQVHFYKNTASYGGAVYLGKRIVPSTFKGCAFRENNAYIDKKESAGGAIYCNTPSKITLEDILSYGNSSKFGTNERYGSEFYGSRGNYILKGTCYLQLPIDNSSQLAKFYPTNEYDYKTYAPQLKQSNEQTISIPGNILPVEEPNYTFQSEKPCAPDVNCALLDEREILSPVPIITTDAGTLAKPNLNSLYCYSEAKNATVTMSSLTGKAPFTFKYKIKTINGATKKVEESEKSIQISMESQEQDVKVQYTNRYKELTETEVTVKYVTAKLPLPIPKQGVSYIYKIIEVLDANGGTVASYTCENEPSLSAKLNVNPEPEVQVEAPERKVCIGGELKLNANLIQSNTLTDAMKTAGGAWVDSKSAKNWSWIGPNEFTSTAKNPTVSNNAAQNMSGGYTVTVTDNNGCQVTKTVNVTVGRCEGVWIGSENTTWGNSKNWEDGYIPSEGDDVKFADNAQSDLHVPGTATSPTIIGNLTNNSKKALVVPVERAITINGEVTGSGSVEQANKIQIKAAKDKANGTLYAPNMCKKELFGTVELYAKGFHEEGEIEPWTDNIVGSPTINQKFSASYHWQYFGVPVKTVKADPTFYKAYLREYHEVSNDKNRFYQKWTDLDNGSTLKAFYGYEITQEKQTTYQIAGELQTCDQPLTLTRKAAPVTGATGANKHYGLGQNIFGNSYTTAIKVHEIEFPQEVEPTVYLYNTGSFVSWGNQTGTQINQGAQMAGQYTSIPKETGSVVYDGQIPSMNGFLLKFTDNETHFDETHDAKVTLNYKAVAVNNTKPQTAAKAQLSYLEVELASKSTVDRLWLFSQEGTTEGFDNGWDGRKFFGTPTAFIYSETPAGNMQVNTTANLDNKVISFYANGDTEYTLSINKKGLENYANLTLLDLETQKVIALKDDQTVYHFTAKRPNVASKRFKVVNSSNITDEMLHNVNGYVEIQQWGNKISVTNYTQQAGVMQVFDVSGKLVMSKPMNVGVNEYELHLDRGAYIVSGSTETGNGQKRIIVS